MPLSEVDRQRLREFVEPLVEASHEVHLGLTVSIDDGEGLRFAYANDAAAAIIGERAEDLVGQPATFRVATEDVARIGQLTSARRRGEPTPRTMQTVIERKDGTRVPLELGVSYVPFRGHTAVVCFFQDVSDRVRAIEALSASEARFRKFIEAAPDIIGVSREGRWVYANPVMVKLFGAKSADEVVGRRLDETIHPNDHKQLEERIRSIGDPLRATSVEYRFIRPDGEERILDVATIAIEFEGAPAMLGFARDVTEQSRARARLVEADRLAAMGTLAAGVGHEINNPLAYVLLNLQSLEREIDRIAPRETSEAAHSMVANAIEGIERVRTIVSALRSFSRADPEAREALEIARVLASALSMASHEIRHRARIVTEIDDVVPRVYANEARIGQVLLNLLLNAAQALPDRGADVNVIRVTVKRGEGNEAIVEVADNGAGVPEVLRARIFEPFFTTKAPGVGTGLGLAICRGIVVGLGGSIVVEDAPEGGALFRVTLPGATTTTTSSRKIPAAERSVRRRVLVVDDEAPLARALERALGVYHDVTVAHGGREALDLLASDATFDVVLCDLMMPKTSGIDVYEELRTRAPEIARRMVFMTGGASTPRASAFLAHIGNAHVEKPFDMRVLEALIERVSAAR
jgi:PAS domain S-box-containing protein